MQRSRGLSDRLYAVFLQNALLGIALTCLLQFACCFPTQGGPREQEACLVLILTCLYTLWEKMDEQS